MEKHFYGWDLLSAIFAINNAARCVQELSRTVQNTFVLKISVILLNKSPTFKQCHLLKCFYSPFNKWTILIWRKIYSKTHHALSNCHYPRIHIKKFYVTLTDSVIIWEIIMTYRHIGLPVKSLLSKDFICNRIPRRTKLTTWSTSLSRFFATLVARPHTMQLLTFLRKYHLSLKHLNFMWDLTWICNISANVFRAIVENTTLRLTALKNGGIKISILI